MYKMFRCAAMGLVAGVVLGCSAAPGSDVGTSQAPVVAACNTDPYYCDNEPFAVGAWIGDDGPFNTLVLSDEPCSDTGYCFFGELADGTRVDGEYFDRPELVRFHWRDTGLMFQGFGVQGDLLRLYQGPEGHIVPVATLRRVASYCEEVGDCALQATAPASCRHATTECRANACQSVCPADQLVVPRKPATTALRRSVVRAR